MDIIDLPFVSRAESIGTALERMRATGVHAVAAETSKGGYRVLFNTDLFEGIDTRKHTRETRIDALTKLGYAAVPVPGTSPDFEADLDRLGAKYGIVSVEPEPAAKARGRKRAAAGSPVELAGLVRVVTRHETLAYVIQTAKPVCRCADNHDTSGSECHVCGKPVTCY